MAAGRSRSYIERGMKDRLPLAATCLLGLSIMGAFLWSQRDWLIGGENDFAAFYSGAHLLGEGELYNTERLHENETRFLGDYARTHGYVRAPFHAVMLWPLTRLPYMTAFLVFEALSAAAFVAFIWLWPTPAFKMRLAFACFALPAFSCFVTGQDDLFLLLWIAGAVLLHRKGRKFAAGALFSLCAMKFHLFLLTPVLILSRRAWTFGRGLLAGGATLTLVSFVAGGWAWPLEMLETSTNPDFTPNAHIMPNLAGVLNGVENALAWEMLIGVAIAIAFWFIARSSNFEYALAGSLVGGVLLSHHSYLADCALLIPAALVGLAEGKSPAVRLAGAALLTPITYFAGGSDSPTASAVFVMLAMLLGMTYEVATTVKPGTFEKSRTLPVATP